MEEELNPFMKEMLMKMSEVAKQHGHSLEFVEGAINYLVNKTRATLTPDERIQATAELATYPRWKILRIDEFDESFGRVWGWLNELVLEEKESAFEDQGYKRLPDAPNLSQSEKECGSKLLAGLSEAVLSAKRGKAKEEISELHKRLRSEYPRFCGSLEL